MKKKDSKKSSLPGKAKPSAGKNGSRATAKVVTRDLAKGTNGSKGEPKIS